MGKKDPFKSVPFFLSLYEGCDGYLNIYIPAEKENIFIPLSEIASMIPKVKKQFKDKDIHFSAATRRKNDESKSGIIHIPALWCDVDLFYRRSLKEVWDGFPLKPSARLNKGAGYQIYWFLERPATIDQIPKLELVLKRLASCFIGHRTTADASNVLMVPGSKNLERDGFQTQLEIFRPERRYLISDFGFLPLLIEKRFPWLKFLEKKNPD